MRRTKTSESRDLGEVRLFIDDVEELEALYKGSFPMTELQIRSGDHEFESAADLANAKGDRLHELDLSIERPEWVSIDLRPRDARITIPSRDDLTMRGFADRAVEILTRRKTWPLAEVAGIAAAIVLLVTALDSPDQQPYAPLVAGLAAAVAVACAYYWFDTSSKRRSTVFLRRSDERVSPLKANRDVVIAVISSAVTAVATAVITYVITVNAGPG